MGKRSVKARNRGNTSTGDHVLQLGRSVERQFATGIMRYLAPRENWTFMNSPIDEELMHGGAARDSWADCFIISALSRRPRNAARSCRKTVVNLIELPLGRDLPTVCVDNEQAGRMAFSYLRSRGLRRFAYLPWAMAGDDHLRCKGFMDAAREQGMAGSTRVIECVLSQHEWLKDIQRQAEIFGRELEPGTGMLCFADWLASLAMVALKRAGLAIPEDVAVMGLGDDEMVCLMTRPQLTSIDLNQTRVGYEAAELLETLVAGGKPPAVPIHVASLGVIVRGSTQLMACDDADVSAAILFIEAQVQAGQRPSVSDVCRKVMVPRRTLDSKFARHLGHTTSEVITRCQLQLTLRLLERLETKFQDVANRAGMRSITQLSRFVRRHTGKTPGEYRQWAQSQQPPSPGKP